MPTRLCLTHIYPLKAAIDATAPLIGHSGLIEVSDWSQNTGGPEYGTVSVTANFGPNMTTTLPSIFQALLLDLKHG